MLVERDGRDAGDDRQGREDPGRVQPGEGRRLPADRLREPPARATQDFNDDTKDAGEIGAGHHVTALYELVPAGPGAGDSPAVDPLEVPEAEPAGGPAADRPESLLVKLRYKQPDGDTSKLIKRRRRRRGAATYATASDDFKFAGAVAGFGMLLRDSPHKGNLTYDAVLELASSAAGRDPQGYRREFLALVRKAQMLSK